MTEKTSGVLQKLFPEIREPEPELPPAPAAEAPANAAPRSPRRKPVNRQQLLLRSVDVERLIAEEHPARGI
jgi:hypothetical protein